MGRNVILFLKKKDHEQQRSKNEQAAYFQLKQHGTYLWMEQQSKLGYNPQI